jgi:hypothetical protein
MIIQSVPDSKATAAATATATALATREGMRQRQARPFGECPRAYRFRISVTSSQTF